MNEVTQNKVVDVDFEFEGTRLMVKVKVDTNLDGQYAVENNMIIDLGEAADEIKDKFFN